MQLRYTIPILSVFSVCLFVLGQGGLVNPTLSSNGGGSGGGTTNSSSGFAATNRPTASGIPAGQGTIFTWPDFLGNTVSFTNMIPSTAMYDDGTTYGLPAYLITAPPGVYTINNVTNGGNDQGAADVDFNTSVIGGPFTNLSTSFIVYATNPNTKVYTSVSAWSTNVVGFQNVATSFLYSDYINSPNINGAFNGTLSGSVVITDNLLSTNVQFHNKALFSLANGGTENFITSTNTANASTLSVVRIGTNGYTDINFETANTIAAVPGSTVLHFAVGRSIDPSAGVYTNNYIELVDQDNFFFLINGTIYGGVKGHTGNLIWYQNNTTNTPMFEVNRSSNFVMVTNLIVGNETNIASFTIVNTNWISGQLYTNQTGRPIQVIMPCQITMTGVAGNSTFALRVTGVTTNALSMTTLITSLATSLTNQVSAWVAAGGTFTGTNLSSGTGDSGGPVNGGQYMVY